MIFTTIRKVTENGDEKIFGDIYIFARDWNEAEKIASAISPDLKVEGQLISVCPTGLNGEVLFEIDFNNIQN